jgi:hypothetical protein
MITVIVPLGAWPVKGVLLTHTSDPCCKELWLAGRSKSHREYTVTSGNQDTGAGVS